MQDVNIVLWIKIIRGYMIQGYTKDSLKLFDPIK